MAIRQYGANIFDLPLFLREHIYDCLFDGAVVGVNLKGNRFDSDCCPPYAHREDGQCLTLAIAQTCRFVRAEALPRFYRIGIIWLCCHSNNMKLLVMMLKHGKPEGHEKNDTGESFRHGRTDIDEAAAVKRHLKTVSEILGYVRRIRINSDEVNLIGWDVESWTWTSFLHKTFPKLKSFVVSVDILACPCGNMSPLHRTARDLYRAEKTGQFRSSLFEYDPSDVSDGEYVRRMWRSIPSHIQTRLDVCFYWGCYNTSVGIKMTLDLDEAPNFELIEYCDDYETNQMTIKFLEDLGMQNQADKIREMDEANAADTYS